MKNFKAMGAAKASKQRGFTIIELVVVILLLGILTATALPRFLDISTEAHNAVVDGSLGGLRTGAALYRSNWYALSQTTDGTQFTGYGNMNPSSTGYPVGVSGGTLANQADQHTECENVFDLLLQIGAPTTITGEDFAYTGYTDNDTAYTPDDTDLAEVNGQADYLAALTANGACSFFYIADAERATSAAPRLTYSTSTGEFLRVN